MAIQVSPEERARRLGNVARVLIELSRRAQAEAEANSLVLEANGKTDDTAPLVLQAAVQQSGNAEAGSLT